MPIESSVQTGPISYDDFHSLDYEVMGIVFSIHQNLGRFWDERIYQNELAYRCQKAGFKNVATEVPILVSYKGFVKAYYIDLLIDNIIYELKTAQTLTGEHEKQVINYLMVTGLNHAKLVNMRPHSVEHRFVSTNLTPAKRFDFTVDDEQWQELDDSSIWLKRMIKNLVNEWGTFLDVTLFYDAILYFRGGEDLVVREINVREGSRLVGRQKAHLISPDSAFKLSSVTKDELQYENHLRQFIGYTTLKALHWVNFNHSRIVFKTILR